MKLVRQKHMSIDNPIIKYDGKAFVAWLDKNNILEKRADHMLKTIILYVSDNMNDNNVNHIFAEFSNVISNCDKLKFEDSNQTFAYFIIHFYDRYLRFLKVYRYLCENNKLSFRKHTKVLDVGTGPGQALHALSDIVNAYKDFENENMICDSVESFELDYCEISQQFRNILHHFTEYVIKDQETPFCYVPFHFGSFENLNEMTHKRTTKMIRKKLLIENHINTIYTNVIFSNFLTNEEIISSFCKKIEDISLYLKNQGCIIIVGASSKTRKYKLIYSMLSRIINYFNYDNYKFRGDCEIDVCEKEMLLSSEDNLGIFLIDYHAKLMEYWVKNDWGNLLGMKHKSFYANCMKREETILKTWEINTYRRVSRLKTKK